VRKASPETHAMLENKLAWAPDSIDTILAGGEPNEQWSSSAAPPQPASPHRHRSPSRASTEELLLELRRRIIAPRNRRPESWDGLDPDGDWAQEG
jgi:hypothetical protein